MEKMPLTLTLLGMKRLGSIPTNSIPPLCDWRLLLGINPCLSRMLLELEKALRRQNQEPELGSLVYTQSWILKLQVAEGMWLDPSSTGHAHWCIMEPKTQKDRPWEACENAAPQTVEGIQLRVRKRLKSRPPSVCQTACSIWGCLHPEEGNFSFKSTPRWQMD